MSLSVGYHRAISDGGRVFPSKGRWVAYEILASIFVLPDPGKDYRLK